MAQHQELLTQIMMAIGNFDTEEEEMAAFRAFVEAHPETRPVLKLVQAMAPAQLVRELGFFKMQMCCMMGLC